MCHTELAPKKKCNSPCWRHTKLFQIYLQECLVPISRHQCQAARRAPGKLRCCNLEDLWWPCILHFWWKIVLPVLVALKNFSQIQTKTVISPDFRPLQSGGWCHSLSLWFLWQWIERNSHHFSHLHVMSCPRKNESLSVSFLLTVMEG